MAILGFTYNKLHAEKMKPVKGKVSISNNVSVSDVEEHEVNFQDRKTLKISFKYRSRYEPEVAAIKIDGNLIYMSDKVDDELKKWKKDRKLSEDAMREVINFVLSKCNVEAIVLSRDLNIPSPIPLPKIGGKDKDSKKPKKKK